VVLGLFVVVMSVDSLIGNVVGGFCVGKLLVCGVMGVIYFVESFEGCFVVLKLLLFEFVYDEWF